MIRQISLWYSSNRAQTPEETGHSATVQPINRKMSRQQNASTVATDELRAPIARYLRESDSAPDLWPWCETVSGSRCRLEHLLVSGMLPVCTPLYYPPPPPCFCHKYKNKGLSSPRNAKNINLKDLSRTRRSM